MDHYLFPRLSTGYARVLAKGFGNSTPEEARQAALRSTNSHAPNTSYAATGGPRVPASVLEKLAARLRAAAERSGYPATRSLEAQRAFDFEVVRALSELPVIPAEAARNEMWQYLTCVLLPDLVCWRHGKVSDGLVRAGASSARFLGGVRNALERLYLRATLLSDPSAPDPWVYLEPSSDRVLSEDQFVAVLERTGLARSRAFCTAIARSFNDGAEFVPRSVESPRQTLFREAMKRLTRSLAFVRLAALAGDEVDEYVNAAFADTVAALGGAATFEPVSEVLTEVDPMPAVERHLPAELWSHFLEKHADARGENLERLGTQVTGYVGWLRAQARRQRDVDIDLAEKLHESLAELVRTAEASGHDPVRRTVAAALSYFVSGDDAIKWHEPGGFEDDREIVNAVARALGRPQLSVPWAAEWTQDYGLEEIPVRIRPHFMELLDHEVVDERLDEVLRDHLAYLRIASEQEPGVNLVMAEELTRGFLELLSFAADVRLPERYQAVLRAGVHYFAREEDAAADTTESGLLDDRDVFNAIAIYLGRSELTFVVPSAAPTALPDLTLVKRLSPNDVGETGSHQAGILVPKRPEILAFLPPLGQSVKNPDAMITAVGPDGDEWELRLVYYNSKYFDGTRDEYRITRLTPFFRRHELGAGDALVLKRENGQMSLDFVRADDVGTELGDAAWTVIRSADHPGRHEPKPKTITQQIHEFADAAFAKEFPGDLPTKEELLLARKAWTQQLVARGFNRSSCSVLLGKWQEKHYPIDRG